MEETESGKRWATEDKKRMDHDAYRYRSLHTLTFGYFGFDYCCFYFHLFLERQKINQNAELSVGRCDVGGGRDTVLN